jgi:hypothetical protein
MKQAYYVVHADDVGLVPVAAHKYIKGQNCRAVATYIPQKGESPTVLQMGYVDYLEVTRPAFKTALVDSEGNLLFSDPRKF